MTATLTDNPTARALMQSAYENRYTWDRNFPGYTADVTVKTGGQTYTGKVRVNRNLSADVVGIADETVQQAVVGQLQEVAIHRIRRSFQDTHGKNTFQLGATDETGAVELIVGGKSEGDRYKVRNNEVCMVHRHIHGTVVTINTFSSHQTPQGYLSHKYRSIYRDPQTGSIKNESTYTDNYVEVGGYQILCDRTIESTQDGNTTTTVFEFSNIQLLEA
ncbi:MAG: DUF3386 domain-containing protein [Pseudanabaenaceae cyanobacterium]